MATGQPNKHAARSAQTRQRFIEAAQKLFAERSVDSVSLNEITTAAGQKNRNALQYHFGSRSGLIQAILDHHGDRVAQLRAAFVSEHDLEAWSPAEAAARILVMPLGEYVHENPDGVYYVRMLSQLAALNSPQTNPSANSDISFRQVPVLETLIERAMSHLGSAEAQRRLFLVVTINFHGIADLFRTFEDAGKRQQAAMLEQVVCAITALLEAPPRS